MTFFIYVIFVAVIVGLDQLTKYLVVAGIPLGGHVPFLPGILSGLYRGGAVRILQKAHGLYEI